MQVEIKNPIGIGSGSDTRVLYNENSILSRKKRTISHDDDALKPFIPIVRETQKDLTSIHKIDLKTDTR